MERKTYTEAERKELAAKGQAMPDLSFPIVTIEDLKNAVHLYGNASDPVKAKAFIIKRARALGALHLLPNAWNVSENTVELIDAYRRDLADHGLGLFHIMPSVEVRGFDGGTGDGSLTMTGLAAVYDTPTTLSDRKHGRVTEEIAPGAFDRVLADPSTLVHLNHGHDMNKPMASTDAHGVGRLELRSQSDGLGFFARVNPDVSHIRDAALLMRDGVIRGASFKFHIGAETRTENTLPDGRSHVHYRVNEVSALYDVCVCAQPAYRQAVSLVRTHAAMAAILDSRRTDDLVGDTRRIDPMGVTSPRPEDVEGIGSEHSQSFEAVAIRARLRARLTVATHQLR